MGLGRLGLEALSLDLLVGFEQKPENKTEEEEASPPPAPPDGTRQCFWYPSARSNRDLPTEHHRAVHGCRQRSVSVMGMHEGAPQQTPGAKPSSYKFPTPSEPHHPQSIKVFQARNLFLVIFLAKIPHLP